MRHSLFVLILFLFGCSGVLKAQPVLIDATRIKHLIQQAESIADTNSVEAIRLFEQAKVMSKNAGLTVWLARALHKESYYYFSSLNYEGVIKNCTEAAGIFEKNKLHTEEAKCYTNIGVAYMYLNKFQQALQALFKAAELAESIKDEGLTASINNNIGLVYESLEDWDNALKYAQRSLPYKKKRKDKQGMADTYGNIANLYYYQSKNEEALYYFQLSGALYAQIGDAYNVATNAANLGNLFSDMGQPDAAIFYLDQAHEYQAPRKMKMEGAYCITVAGEAAAWLKKGNMHKAASYLDECSACEQLVSDFSYLKDLYSVKADYYKHLGNYARAVQYLEQANAAQDSINKKSRNLENQKIAIRYEFSKKSREDSLQYQLTLSRQQIASATYRNSMYLALVALVLTACIAIFIINRVRKLQENKRKLALENMRQNIAGDLHDDIGSTLSSIQIISNLALSQRNSDAQLRQSVSRISELSDKVSDGIREIVWSVNPAHDRLETVTTHLRKLAADILNDSSITFTFKENLKEPEKELTPQQRKDLFMIFKEALNNARKYSGTGHIDLFINQHGQMLQIGIKDYGCGFDTDKTERGNGLNNMARRAADINALLDIDTHPGKGTLVSLQVPLP